MKINEDKVLGEGNFGKVCLAMVSREPIRTESEIENSPALEALSGSSNALPTTTIGPVKLKSKFSFRRPHNTTAGANSTASGDEFKQPLLNKKKGCRLAAAKMIKGKFRVLN